MFLLQLLWQFRAASFWGNQQQESRQTVLDNLKLLNINQKTNLDKNKR